MKIRKTSIDSLDSNEATEAALVLNCGQNILGQDKAQAYALTSACFTQKTDPKIRCKMTVNCGREEHNFHLDGTDRTKGFNVPRPAICVTPLSSEPPCHSFNAGGTIAEASVISAPSCPSDHTHAPDADIV